MSALDQIQTTAESAIQELEAEIVDLEEQIEAHRQRIQGAQVQIQALKNFLNPEEVGPVTVKHKAKKNGKAHNEDIEFQGMVS